MGCGEKMKQEFWEHPIFGYIPFKKLTKVVFRVDGLKDRNEAAWLQYLLLKTDAVHLCHIDFASKEGKLLYSDLDEKIEDVFGKMPSAFKFKVKESFSVPYSHLLKSHYHLKEA